MRARYVLADLLGGLRRNLSMTISLVVTVAISLFLVSLGLWTQTQAQRSQDFFYGKAQVAVFFCNADMAQDPSVACRAGAVTPAQRTAVAAAVRGPGVANVVHETQAQAFANFRAEFTDSTEFADVRADQLQESLRVELSDPADTQRVIDASRGLPGVQSVQDLRAVLDPLFTSLRAFQVGAVGLALLLVVVAVLLISNTVRLAAFSRRRETQIMRLVGASNTSIRFPFVVEAVVAGVVGAALAAGAFAAWQQFVVIDTIRPNIRITAWVGWDEVAWIIPALFGLAVLISAIPALVSLRKYLTV